METAERLIENEKFGLQTLYIVRDFVETQSDIVFQQETLHSDPIISENVIDQNFRRIKLVGSGILVSQLHINIQNRLGSGKPISCFPICFVVKSK